MDDTVVIGGEMSLQNLIDGDMNLTNLIDGEEQVVISQEGGTFDHTMLFNREIENQHPIEAISQLEDELEIRPSEALTNMDINYILNS